MRAGKSAHSPTKAINVSNGISFPPVPELSKKVRESEQWKEAERDSSENVSTDSDSKNVIKHEKHHRTATNTAPFVKYVTSDLYIRQTSSFA